MGQGWLSIAQNHPRFQQLEELTHDTKLRVSKTCEIIGDSYDTQNISDIFVQVLLKVWAVNKKLVFEFDKELYNTYFTANLTIKIPYGYI